MDKETVIIGRIIGVHGTRGEVKVLLYGGYGEFPWKSVMVSLPGGKGERVNLVVKSIRRNKAHFLILFESLRGAAGSLVGMDVSVHREDLPPTGEDEYYTFDLVGLEAFSDSGRRLGFVTGIISAGGSDVLAIEGPLGEVLVPVAGGSVINVNLDAKKIIVHLLEGLMNDEV
ncbi:MAG: 16S rRNA processing protein RimM [Deltaproteobacteria bacterium]|nr:16S rRNA processing protein RimM [Deltaproteobacteria bacterium]MBI5810531.1 16S rRNA processing protein RimM [Deltaproteobacteria bacterium]